MPKIIPIKDLINQKYGRLTIIKEVEPHILPCGQKHRKVLCLCDCGNYKEIHLNSLKKSNTQSCGCLRKEKMTKHNLYYHPLYTIWQGMKRRCCNPKDKSYKDWGGRGITVCKEWKNPKTFIKWCLLNGYKKGLIIDRIDNDGNYTPDNVRFVDYGLNSRNTRLLQSNNTSGFRGVCWDKKNKKWQTLIGINGKLKNLSHFNRLKLAALRYDAEAYLLNDGRPMNFIERV